MKTASTISESTRVRVTLGTAWAIISSVVATTVWLTVLIVRNNHANQEEHMRLMTTLTELNLRSENWTSKEQVEEALMFMARELHPADPALTPWKATQMREGIRERLRQKPLVSPKAGAP